MNAALPLALDLGEQAGLATALRTALDAIERHDEQALAAAAASLDRWLSRPLCRTLAAVETALHDALGANRFEERLSQLAGHELPDAATRLDYVIGLTERAAHTTLDLADALRRELVILDAAGVDPQQTARMRGLLNDLQQTQAYQDLTGQVIRHVVDVMQRAEGALRRALIAAGIQPAGANDARAADTRVLSGIDRAAASQDDADDLLADLGL
jgi:chemotaxis protein CheZ